MSSRHNLARYELIAPVFDSCFGTLWEAKLRESAAPRLVRVVPRDRLTADELDRALEAARAAIGVEHPLMLPVMEAEIDDGALVVASERVEGLPLRALLRAIHDKSATIELPVALTIVRDMVQAVTGAQLALHGGLGPDSFLVGADGRTRLMEHGLAPVLRRAKALAQHPDRLGYDAPEVFQVGVQVDARADVFSLGVMLWELMRGERLLRGSLPQLITKFRKGPLPRAEGVPAALADAAQRALELNADDRLATPSDLADQLRVAAPASAKAVAAAIAGILESERDRVRESHRLREHISAKTREASDRPPASTPPASSRRRAAARPRFSVDVVAKRMDAPTSLVPLWIVLAVGLVGGVGYMATRSRVAERAHYIMQVVRPPTPTATATASASASSSVE